MATKAYPKTVKKTTKTKEIISNESEQQINIEESSLSNKTDITNFELYNSYIQDNKPYRIYFRNSLIYDSVKCSDNPEFLDDYFILFGKKYIYRGIRIEKY